VIIGMIKAEILQGTSEIRYCPFDESLWEDVFRIAFQMRRKGFSTPVTDVVIGVSALNAGATVLHADKHFDELSKVTGLKVKGHVSELRK
jgi:predicted nucleic acid-binding protein